VEIHELSGSEPFFWMGGRLAYDLLEVTNDLASISDGGFWAVSSTFEGQWRCAKFAKVVESSLPRSQKEWTPLGGKWRTSLHRDEYMKYVEEIREQISLGWVYQVNACRQLSIPYPGDSLLPLMHDILRLNPAPYASYLCLPDLEIASASPELFLQRNGNDLLSAPIKGTKHLDDGDRKFGDKDQAENIMIVDLIRNDLGQICQTGSVKVSELLQSQDHPGLVHLVSYVEGKVKDGLEWAQILDAIVPPGSVSGAPKSSALSTIWEMENLPRGPYCGALGWIEGDRASISVAIRIFWDAKDGSLRFGTGAGITWGSDASSEWEETELKARRLISIAGGEL
jgi:para-aminobenzoate synthetase component 1